MSDTSTALPVRVDGPVSIARLHGRACWHCGTVAKDLTAAGTVTIGSDGRKWTIVSCGCQATAAARGMAPTGDTAALPVDIDTMRATAALVLGPDDGPDALPPAAEVDTLTETLRGHVELLIPEVARAAGPRPYSVQSYCALACVGEARGKLRVTPGQVLEVRVAYARKLARSAKALCDHYERLTGEAARRG